MRIISFQNDKGVVAMYSSRILSMGINFTLFLYASKILDENEIYRLGILLTSVSLFQILTEFGIGGSVIQDRDFKDSSWSSLLSLYYILTIPVALIGTLIINIVFSFELDFWFYIILGQLILQPWVNLYNTINVKGLNLYRRYSIEICANIIGFTLSFLALKNFVKADFYIVYFLIFNFIVFIFNYLRFRVHPKRFQRSFAKNHLKFGSNITLSNSLEPVIDGLVLYSLKNNYGVNISAVFFQIKKFATVPISLQILYVNNEVFPRLAMNSNIKINHIKQYERIFVILSLIGLAGMFVLLRILDIWQISDFRNLILLSPAIIFVLLEILWRIPLKLKRETGAIFKTVFVSRLIGAFVFLCFTTLVKNYELAFLSFLSYYLYSYYVFKFKKN